MDGIIADNYTWLLAGSIPTLRLCSFLEPFINSPLTQLQHRPFWLPSHNTQNQIHTSTVSTRYVHTEATVNLS